MRENVFFGNPVLAELARQVEAAGNKDEFTGALRSDRGGQCLLGVWLDGTTCGGPQRAQSSGDALRWHGYRVRNVRLRERPRVREREERSKTFGYVFLAANAKEYVHALVV